MDVVIKSLGKEKATKLVAAFKSEVWDPRKKVDPQDEYDWCSLAIGWGLAKGLTPPQSKVLASYLTYSAFR